MLKLRDSNTCETFNCCGVEIATMSSREATWDLVERARQFDKVGVHLCNAYTLSLAASNSDLRESLNQNSLNLADGTPVAWLGWLGGYRNMRGPVRGPDLMLNVMRAGVDTGMRHYLYGASEATLVSLKRNLERSIPGISIVGSESPPYRALSASEMSELCGRISAAAPNVLWVALGTPKQDMFIAAVQGRIIGLAVGVGAAFDFAAGTVPEAPRWMRGTGFEWAYRLAREPRRLWRRYLIGNVRFMLGVIRLR